MKSVMKHQFSQAPQANIQRSSFDRTHGYKTTFDSGKLVPFFVDEVLPGDTFKCDVSAFARMATPIYPVMDNMYMETFFFFVPNRLIWNNFQKFMGEQANPGDSIDYLVPTVTTAAGFAEGSLADYFGIPTKVAGLEVNALPFRAYNLIYNEWFRDQNLQNWLTVDKDDGPDTEGAYLVRNRNKRHDYFTSALPWPQKGDSVDIPLGTTAPVNVVTGTTQSWQAFNAATDTAITGVQSIDTTAGGYTAATTTPVYFDPRDTLEADLSTATAATINQLRQAFQVQKLLEKDARGGTRYTEIIRSHFGVTSPDARLQRPEYLGGGSSPININPIAQTSSTDGTSPQGNLAAMATASFNGHGFSKSFTEHGFIIGLVNVRADLTYQQGLNRMWSRQTRLDYYWPSLAHIGEQTVLSKEIYTDGSANDDDVFGYQERYAEYRYKPSQITGQFRSNATTPLDSWHLSQDFSVRPTLGDTFIQDSPPVSRVVAVPSEPEFIFDSYIKMRCARPMPLYGIPGMIDHF